MYKSSPLTFIFKYVFPVFMLGSWVFGIFMIWNQGTPESQGFVKGMIVMGIWIAFFLVQQPFRLKYIEATESELIIKGFGEESKVDYKDIEWVTYFDLTSPFFVTIKYKDQRSEMVKKVSFMPNQNDQKIFGNDAMTEFIREKIKAANPKYTKNVEPSKVKNFLLIAVLGLPFTILAMYFMLIY